MSEPAVGLMAKYPGKGKVKARLTETIGARLATDIYLWLLKNVMSVFNENRTGKMALFAFITPPEKTTAFRNQFDCFDFVFPQSGDDLGDRMKNAFIRMQKERPRTPLILIGADIPGMTFSHIEKALALMVDHDLVLGPAEDGGYYLIALKKINEFLFSDIEWGSTAVLAQTLKKAKANNLTCALLPCLRDLDTVDDLDYFLEKGNIDRNILKSIRNKDDIKRNKE